MLSGAARVLAGDVASAVSDGIGAPPFFCPILREGDFTLAQTPAIMEFLGRKHGYIPEGAEAQANCLQLALNVSSPTPDLASINRLRARFPLAPTACRCLLSLSLCVSLSLSLCSLSLSLPLSDT